jgi:hypothetical protein
LPLAALALAGGCSETRTGRVSLALQVSPGVTLSSANYYVIAPDGEITSGGVYGYNFNATVPVGATSDVPVPIGSLIGWLPDANGYQLIVSGASSDGTVGCSGQTTFDVTDGQEETIIVHLTCGESPAPGQVLVSGIVNICPMIDSMSANPASVTVGHYMQISMTFHDSDNGPFFIQPTWTASGPAMINGDGSSIWLYCEAPGTVTVNLLVSDSECSDQMSVDVTCTES